MSVKVVRTRSGEDIITDIREVALTEDEQQKVIGFQLLHPYVVWVSDGMEAEDDQGNIHKISSPEITMTPWMPLSKEKKIFVRPDEIVSAYETYPDVLEKYKSLVEAINGIDSEDSSSEER